MLTHWANNEPNIPFKSETSTKIKTQKKWEFRSHERNHNNLTIDIDQTVLIILLVMKIILYLLNILSIILQKRLKNLNTGRYTELVFFRWCFFYVYPGIKKSPVPWIYMYFIKYHTHPFLKQHFNSLIVPLHFQFASPTQLEILAAGVIICSKRHPVFWVLLVFTVTSSQMGKKEVTLLFPGVTLS
jgi:hypothetical protein